MVNNIKQLLDKLNEHTLAQLHAAAGFALSSSHYEITLEHLFIKFLDDGEGDISKICQLFQISENELRQALVNSLSDYRTGNTGRPSFSPHLITMIEQAWMIASIETNSFKIRSAHLIASLFTEFGMRNFSAITDICSPVTKDNIIQLIEKEMTGSVEENVPVTEDKQTSMSGEAQSALNQFTENLTEKAKAGKIDPVFARDDEIRQMIDVLSRCGKNNPILVGDPGTGKTAIVEGLALKVIENEVPLMFTDVDILVLNMGLLQAGASVKGEFENRLKNVIQGIRSYPKPVITFIDEAHTLIGAGGTAGQNDAANLLKPALARGELRTIAATTWSEYKKYFEKDDALTRRFQLIKVDEPENDDAITIMRGLRNKYESHHKVRITDNGIQAAVKLSRRYIVGRQLPDKAIDLLDTASARVALSQNSTPYPIQKIQQQIAALDRENSALIRDRTHFKKQDDYDNQCNQLFNKKQSLQTLLTELNQKWQHEKEMVQHYLDDFESFMETTDEKQLKSLSEQIQNLKDTQKHQPLVFSEVNESVIASVLADWTGIPMGNMLSDESNKLRQLYDNLSKCIIGQKFALKSITQALQVSKTRLNDPGKPTGVFLLVGPSGVGKTETAISLADLFFGGSQYLVTINMSEYQEKHNVSRLIGSPPGYVGYGEGGILTEAVRQKPYTVVLLDEIEKAHPDVIKLFYQVFDKGILQDGEGRVADFKNTLVIMTTNATSETILEIMSHIPKDAEPVDDDVIAYIHPQLKKHFETAFLARTSIIPYYPLSEKVLQKIVHLKLQKIQERMDNFGAVLDYGQDVLNWLLEHCQAAENGARNVEHTINNHILPVISKAMLEHMDTPEFFKQKALVLQIDDSKKLLFQIVDANAIAKESDHQSEQALKDGDQSVEESRDVDDQSNKEPDTGK
ncbi:type VI secretion ATPase, ClpV1 family [Candidatus Magnetomorum sp. HK-1]|nr:type VI secretion ATPase, ClpV1 family [Candidatus Magnetomorum sp. HK-1]